MGYDEPRNPEGVNEPTTSDSEIVDAMEVNEPYSTTELADRLDLAHSTVHRRLQQLADEGTIRKKKHGHRTVTWMLPEGGGEA